MRKAHGQPSRAHSLSVKTLRADSPIMSSLQFKNLEEIRNEKDCFLCQSETGKHLASSIFNLLICPLPRLNAALLLPFSLQAGRGGTSDAHDTRGAYFVVCVCVCVWGFCGCACAAIPPALLAFLIAPWPSQGGREGGGGGVVAGGKDSGDEFASAHSSSQPQEAFFFFSP
jgi:hypothetical protein